MTPKEFIYKKKLISPNGFIFTSYGDKDYTLSELLTEYAAQSRQSDVNDSLPYTQEELNKYIEETYSWVNEHPKELMHIVAKWVTEKFVSSQLSNGR